MDNPPVEIQPTVFCCVFPVLRKGYHQSEQLQTTYLVLKTQKSSDWVGETAQQLRACIDLAEDPNLVPRINPGKLTMASNASSRTFNSIF